MWKFGKRMIKIVIYMELLGLVQFPFRGTFSLPCSLQYSTFYLADRHSNHSHFYFFLFFLISLSYSYPFLFKHYNTLSLSLILLQIFYFYTIPKLFFFYKFTLFQLLHCKLVTNTLNKQKILCFQILNMILTYQASQKPVIYKI